MRLELDFEVDVRRSLGVLWHGPSDRSLRLHGRVVERASRTPAGPASLRLAAVSGRSFEVEAWGPGAELAVAGLPDLLGAADEPAAFEPRHRLLAELVRRWPGLRLTRTGAVFDSLLPAIVSQKVSGVESSSSYRALVERFGEPAPGPLGLRLPPAPEVLAEQPYWRFHELGLEQRRADVIRRAAAATPALERAAAAGSADLRRRLLALPGIGAWTAAETIRPALGDADAISVGDYNLPHLVSWTLAGEPRGSDERMLELLEPYAGQRARAVLLLELSGLRPPRFGPRLPVRSIATL
jgi:3-methyladenine DNA glycosylase/8-oxoguanine DNA glycosylase